MTFFRTMFRCCSGFQTYRDVRDRPLTASLFYLAQLIILLGLILAFRFVPAGWRLTDTVGDWAQAHVPPFRIQQGNVIADVPQPYRAGDDNFLFLLDTTGKATAADPEAMHGVLVTADALLFWMKPDRNPSLPVFTQRHNLRGFPDSTITADYIRNFLRAGILMSIPILFAAASFLVVAQILLFSFAAAILERGMAGGLRWPQLFNIALHAVTPAAIIFTTYLAMRLEGFDLQLIYIIAYGVFLLGATNACRTPVAEETPADNEWR
ncbi:MAG: DUF1189 domain-containing protein [Verrucomicrobia bacterium]|nr:DUF1189 domain-containing protein [Verrucomicrobiota bacterium]